MGGQLGIFRALFGHLEDADDDGGDDDDYGVGGDNDRDDNDFLSILGMCSKNVSAIPLFLLS